jgi:hypothetical protein
MRSAHPDHLINDEALEIRIAPSAPALCERLRYRESHQTVVRVSARTREKMEFLAFVVHPFVLATDYITYNCSYHFSFPF